MYLQVIVKLCENIKQARVEVSCDTIHFFYVNTYIPPIQIIFVKHRELFIIF